MAKMTRVEALSIFELSVDDIQKPDIDNIIHKKFNELARSVHPDTCADYDINNDLSIEKLKAARDVLIMFAADEMGKHKDESDDVCPYCLGLGVVKVYTQFGEVHTKVCDCVKVVRK